MGHLRMRRLAAHTVLAAVVVLSASACAPATAAPNRPIEVAANDGRRLDLVVQVDAVTGASSIARRDVVNVVGALWSESATLRTWFTVVERIANAPSTVILATSVTITSNSRQITTDDNWAALFMLGIPPGLRSNSIETRASVSLVDAATGVVLSSGLAVHTTSNLSVGEADGERIGLRAALSEAIQGAMRDYAGR